MPLGEVFRVVAEGTRSWGSAFEWDAPAPGRRRKPPESTMKWTPPKIASVLWDDAMEFR
jgi:hypothetical protein